MLHAGYSFFRENAMAATASKSKRKGKEKKKKGRKASSDDFNKPMEHPLVVVSDEENLPAVSNPALHRYLQEISHYPLLTREETDELAKRFQETGDPDAAYRLVSSNLRLVVKVAMDFQKYWMQNFMDLIQEGNVGLVQATKKFDPYRGVKFSY
jgi:RNA polymerase sigma-32 factor